MGKEGGGVGRDGGLRRNNKKTARLSLDRGDGKIPIKVLEPADRTASTAPYR